MKPKGSSGVRDEAEEFTETLGRFLSTLGAVVSSAAQWLGLAFVGWASSSTENLSEQTDSVAAGTRSMARTVRRKTRNLVVKLALVAVFLWWLDRDLSEADRT